jgi:hypothetical protein
VNVGDFRDLVIAALGEPDHSLSDVVEYDEEVSYANRSLNSIRLYFERDRVAKIEWIYWLQ